MSEKQRSCWQAVTMLHSPTRWRNVLIKPLPYAQTRIYHHSGPHILREIKQYLVSGLFWRKEEMPSYSWDSLACLLGFFFLSGPKFPQVFTSRHIRVSAVSQLWTINATESGKPHVNNCSLTTLQGHGMGCEMTWGPLSGIPGLALDGGGSLLGAGFSAFCFSDPPSLGLEPGLTLPRVLTKSKCSLWTEERSPETRLLLSGLLRSLCCLPGPLFRRHTHQGPCERECMSSLCWLSSCDKLALLFSC